jgi:DNA polymerase (family X)
MLASSALQDAQRAGFSAASLIPVGSLRRFAPDVGDVRLLAIAPADTHQALLHAFTRLPLMTRVIGASPSQVKTMTERGAVTLQLAVPDDAGAALVWHTGSRQHTQQLQRRARRLGLAFEHGRLTDAAGAAIPAMTEHALYHRLELPYIAPELREGVDEIAVAERGELPSLVTGPDIRGDLHMHTSWSDGRDSIGEMIVASQELGYEYVAITDHSERSMASRRLTAGDLPRQRDEIAARRSRVTGIELLHGVEVDIMFDGSLDFDDAILEKLDIVLASLHDHGGQDAEQLMERYLRAIRHPLVNIITHPANRSPGRFGGYDLDFERLFAAAAETGTAMEIDGAPGHLDMDGAIARRAVAAGVTVVINSDGHRADALGRQMRFGVGTARRGWIESARVLNTRGIDAVRQFIAGKRARA